MFRSRIGRVLAVFLFAAALAAPSVWAAPPAWSPTTPADLWNRLWGTLTALWAEAGCILDPHGGCAATTMDEGCIIDPNGGCAAPSTDEGCILDPNGGCGAPRS